MVNHGKCDRHAMHLVGWETNHGLWDGNTKANARVLEETIRCDCNSGQTSMLIANDRSEGSASRICQLNASEPLKRPTQWVRCLRPPKPEDLTYGCVGIEGSWAYERCIAYPVRGRLCGSEPRAETKRSLGQIVIFGWRIKGLQMKP
jgi:hypothetical protein